MSAQRPFTRRSAGQHKGFTLIEVMIVVAVLGILTAIALPNYNEYVLRSRRAEARAGLLQAAQWMERVATATGRYINDASQFPASLTTVNSRAYAIDFPNPDPAGASYTLRATPQNAQVNDKCGGFTLDNTGARGLTITGASSALLEECWSR